MVKRYKRAAVSEVSGIKLLNGVPVIEGKVIRQKDGKEALLLLIIWLFNQ